MSGIDLSRFHQTFFEESLEGLDLMESALLRLSAGSADPDTVNTVFRAAHSIKGGAGTFGFMAMADFTHRVETLLDRMRDGRHAASAAEIDLLLRSVDALRGLLGVARGEAGADISSVGPLTDELERVLSGAAAAPDAADAPQAAVAAEPVGWSIHFSPHRDLFASGNDPLRILAELQRLGPCEIVCETEALPELRLSHSESCYLSWRIRLSAPCTREAVRDVFAWVEDDCRLEIEPILAVAAAPASLPAKTAAVAEADPRPALSVIEGGRQNARDKAGDSGSIRIATSKIDSLINLVGELVITQAMLQQLADQLDPVANEKLLSGLSQLDRNTRELQEAVMSARMLPVEFVFSRFPRLTRDLAAKLGKQVRLVTVGEQTELDKGVIERISDPLVHLVRNALDHGIEMPDVRAAAGKDPTGTLKLSAAHQGGYIVIEIADDGRGLDRERLLAKARERELACSEAMSDAEVWQLIFAPGFSTAASVTDVSGRGVGMDVVKKNIESLGGAVDVSSETGSGMRVTIRLPLTLAILDGMSVRVGDEIFIVPLSAVVESLQPQPGQVRALTGESHVVKVRNEYVPLAELSALFGIPTGPREPHSGILVLMEADGRKIAARVDELVGQQQVVIKSLESNYRRVRGISGATILGDGRVALILDVAALVRVFSSQAQAA
jgi:two-component system chemotaxis sensor kinase CheA